MMNRRKFLKLAIAGSSFMVINIIAFSFFSSKRTYEEMIFDIVTNRLSFLSLETVGVRKFSKDYLSYRELTRREKIALTLLSRLKPINHYFPEDIIFRLEKLEKKIVKKYLFSTDFFNKSKIKKTKLVYIGYADPYESPCSNAFATFIQL